MGGLKLPAIGGLGSSRVERLAEARLHLDLADLPVRPYEEKHWDHHVVFGRFPPGPLRHGLFPRAGGLQLVGPGRESREYRPTGNRPRRQPPLQPRPQASRVTVRTEGSSTDQDLCTHRQLGETGRHFGPFPRGQSAREAKSSRRRQPRRTPRPSEKRRTPTPSQVTVCHE